MSDPEQPAAPATLPDGTASASASEAAAASETDVLTRLVQDHHAAVYRYAFRLSGSAADAEDLTQQAFLIAQQKADQIRDAELAGRWLLAVVRNAFLKTRRRRIPLPAGGLEIDMASVPDPVTENGKERASEEPIDSASLQAALDELPDEFRVPLVMYYFEESSYREIAEQLDLPQGTVMSRLSRAKSHLRRLLGKRLEVRG